MKLRHQFVFELIFFGGIVLGCLTGLIYLTFGDSANIPFRTGFWCVFAVLSIAITAILIFDIKQGNAYFKDVFASIDEFKKYKFKNLLVIAHNDFAYVYRHDIEKIDNLKEIKVRKFYNLKKEGTGMVWIPYTQI